MDALQAAYDRLIDPQHRGLHILTGGPGCGKSFVMRHAAKERAVLDGVCLMASTNAAAQLISHNFADTVHATCDIPVKSTVVRGFNSGAAHARTLSTVRCFFIDEFSLLTGASLQRIVTRIAEAQVRVVYLILVFGSPLLCAWCM